MLAERFRGFDSNELAQNVVEFQSKTIGIAIFSGSFGAAQFKHRPDVDRSPMRLAEGYGFFKP